MWRHCHRPALPEVRPFPHPVREGPGGGRCQRRRAVCCAAWPSDEWRLGSWGSRGRPAGYRPQGHARLQWPCAARPAASGTGPGNSASAGPGGSSSVRCGRQWRPAARRSLLERPPAPRPVRPMYRDRSGRAPPPGGTRAVPHHSAPVPSRIARAWPSPAGCPARLRAGRPTVR